MRTFIVVLLALGTAAVLCADPVIHVLKKGETIYSIARSYDVSVDAVLSVNSITDPRSVAPGRKLVIPSVYRVVKGDTLYGIARRFNISVDELQRLNRLSPAVAIKAGDVLYVPSTEKPDSGVPEKPSGVASSVPTASVNSTVKPANPAVSVADTVPVVRPSTPASGSSGAWPASGKVSYLEGKLFGVMIETTVQSSIVAVRSGVVRSAGPFRGYGRVAFVEATDGLVYVYGGAGSLTVKVDDPIRAGMNLGLVGPDFATQKPVVYFFVFKNGKAIDPVKAPRE